MCGPVCRSGHARAISNTTETPPLVIEMSLPRFASLGRWDKVVSTSCAGICFGGSRLSSGRTNVKNRCHPTGKSMRNGMTQARRTFIILLRSHRVSRNSSAAMLTLTTAAVSLVA